MIMHLISYHKNDGYPSLLDAKRAKRDDQVVDETIFDLAVVCVFHEITHL
jgi:hypothetical protein